MCRRARKVVRGTQKEEGGEGRWRSMSSKEVWRRMGLRPIREELRKRRWQRWRGIVGGREEARQVRAAVWGSGSTRGVDLAEVMSPWRRMAEKDMRDMAEAMGDECLAAWEEAMERG